MAQRWWHSADLKWSSPSLSSHPKSDAPLYFPTKPTQRNHFRLLSLPYSLYFLNLQVLWIYILSFSSATALLSLDSSPGLHSRFIQTSLYIDSHHHSYILIWLCLYCSDFNSFSSPKPRLTLLGSALEIPIIWPLPICPVLCLSSSLEFTQALLGLECSLASLLCLCTAPAPWDGFLIMICPVTPGPMLPWHYPTPQGRPKCPLLCAHPPRPPAELWVDLALVLQLLSFFCELPVFLY